MNTITVKLSTGYLAELEVIYMDSTYVVHKTPLTERIEGTDQYRVYQAEDSKTYIHTEFKYTVAINTANCVVDKFKYDRVALFNNKAEAVRFVNYLSPLQDHRILNREKDYIRNVMFKHCKAYKPLRDGYYQIGKAIYHKGSFAYDTN